MINRCRDGQGGIFKDGHLNLSSRMSADTRGCSHFIHTCTG